MRPGVAAMGPAAAGMGARLKLLGCHLGPSSFFPRAGLDVGCGTPVGTAWIGWSSSSRAGFAKGFCHTGRTGLVPHPTVRCPGRVVVSVTRGVAGPGCCLGRWRWDHLEAPRWLRSRLDIRSERFQPALECHRAAFFGAGLCCFWFVRARVRGFPQWRAAVGQGLWRVFAAVPDLPPVPEGASVHFFPFILAHAWVRQDPLPWSSFPCTHGPGQPFRIRRSGHEAGEVAWTPAPAPCAHVVRILSVSGPSVVVSAPVAGVLLATLWPWQKPRVGVARPDRFGGVAGWDDDFRAAGIE